MPEWLDPDHLLRPWLLIAGAGILIVLALRWIAPRRGPILPPQRRRQSPWTGAHVLFAFLVFACTSEFIVPTIDPVAMLRWIHLPDGDLTIGRLVAGVVARTIALPFQIVMWYGLAWLADGPRRVFGIRPKRFAADFDAGYFAWLVFSPAAYLVNVVVIVFYVVNEGQAPEGHPIVTMLHAAGDSSRLYGLLFIQAVIIAPIGEEMFFRGIVQPFMADRPWGGIVCLAFAAIVGVFIHWPGPGAFNDAATTASAAAPALFVIAVLPAYWCVRWLPIRWLPVHDPLARRQAARAIIGTAILFANFHSNVWPTPIALFVLALGLGWLAYRTQSVVAPIVLHMLFNAITVLALFRPTVG